MRLATCQRSVFSKLFLLYLIHHVQDVSSVEFDLLCLAFCRDRSLRQWRQIRSNGDKIRRSLGGAFASFFSATSTMCGIVAVLGSTQKEDALRKRVLQCSLKL